VNTEKSASTYASVKDAVASRPLSTPALYRILAAGHVEARKLGRKTLIDMHSLDAYLSALPAFETRAKRAA
jgi:hypothetical protein